MTNNNLGILVVIGIIMGFIFFSGGDTQVFSAITPTIEFAGFTWQTSGDVSKEGDFAILQATKSNSNGESIAEMTTDITGIDEVLVVGEADVSATVYRAGASASIQVQIRGSEGGVLISSDGVSVNERGGGADKQHKHIDARIYKLKNNFDGTWSTLQSLGVGDIFIVKSTKTISGTPTLALMAVASNSGGGISGTSASSSIKAKFFNVVRKESGFAVCKVDEFIQDINQDGKITPDECFDLATIVLNSEEAIKESFDAKLARIELELLAKNQGLSDEIERLRQLQNTTLQQERLLKLEEELSGTKLWLEQLQQREQDLIESIRDNEQITVINQTVVVIQPTVVNQTIVKEIVVEKEVFVEKVGTTEFVFEEKVFEERLFPPIDEIPVVVWIILGLFIFIIIFLRR